MPWRPSASVQVRASAIWPTAAAAWLSSSLSAPGTSLRRLRPSAMAPDDTTSTSRPSPCRPARSSVSDVSHASLSAPARESTSSEEPTLTTMRRKSVRRGVVMGGLDSSCAGSTRASIENIAQIQEMDGRVKPGHDEVARRSPLRIPGGDERRVLAVDLARGFDHGHQAAQYLVHALPGMGRED